MFTIIILVYNNSKYLEDCIKSIAIQNYKEYEVIIIDDCSQEDPSELIHKIAEKYLGKSETWQYFRNSENMGTVKSANKGISLAKGNLIKLIAADDKFHDENTLGYVFENFKPEMRVLLSRVAKCNEDLVWNGEYECEELQYEIIYNGIKAQKKLAIRNFIAAPGVFFKREFFDKWGLFDETYRLLEDWPMWLRTLRNGEKFYYLEYTTVDYRNDAGVVSGGNPYYLKDRKRCCQNEVLKNFHYYGIPCCIISWLLSIVLSNYCLRYIAYKMHKIWKK